MYTSLLLKYGVYLYLLGDINESNLPTPSILSMNLEFG
jgi:hypothetical protein